MRHARRGELQHDALSRDRRLVLWCRGLRAFADGYVSILLPVYLAERGFDAFAVGAVSTATLLGSALLTLALGLGAYRLPRRGALLAASLLMAGTGLGFAAAQELWPLLVIAFVGTLNPSSGDVSVFLPLEHTVLAQSAPGAERTSVFARYSFIGSVVGAFGTLASGVVNWLGPAFGRATVVDGLFALYAALGPSRRRVYCEQAGARDPSFLTLTQQLTTPIGFGTPRRYTSSPAARPGPQWRDHTTSANQPCRASWRSIGQAAQYRAHDRATLDRRRPVHNAGA